MDVKIDKLIYHSSKHHKHQKQKGKGWGIFPW